ncbi:hypothetical protein HDU76_005599, partial [Blyttiomyces sp. JEL0837]
MSTTCNYIASVSFHINNTNCTDTTPHPSSMQYDICYNFQAAANLNAILNATHLTSFNDKNCTQVHQSYILEGTSSVFSCVDLGAERNISLSIGSKPLAVCQTTSSKSGAMREYGVSSGLMTVVVGMAVAA